MWSRERSKLGDCQSCVWVAADALNHGALHAVAAVSDFPKRRICGTRPHAPSASERRRPTGRGVDPTTYTHTHLAGKVAAIRISMG